MNNLGSANFKPVVGYLRRSTDRQEQSIDDQRRVIEGYAVSNGYNVLDYYVDDAISGASSEGRASFLRLIKDAKQGDCPFKFVLVYDIKRFGRVDNDEAGYYRYQLRRNGVEIIYVSEGFNGDDTDDLLRPVKQWQARQELKDLSKVTIRGLLTRSDGGWWMGGIPPYGYDLAYYDGLGQYLCTVRFMEDGSKQVLDSDGYLTRIVPRGERLQFTKRDKSRLVLGHPNRMKFVKKIFDWYVVEGMGYNSIAGRLNEASVLTPMGGRRRTSKEAKWCSTTIMSILKNPVYTGDMVWNRTSFAKFHKISDGRAVQTRNFPGHGPSRNGEEDWIVHRNAHPAIITRTRYEQTQKRRKATAKNGYANTHNVGRGARSPYLLTGLIHCTHCGHKWIGYTVNKGRRRKDGSNVKTLYYACSGYVNKGKSVCQRHVIRKEWLEEWVVGKIEKMLKKHFGTPEGLKNMRHMIEEEIENSVPQVGDELDTVVGREREIKQTITNLVENLTSTNKEYVDARLIELKREMAVLESKRLELESAGAEKTKIGHVIDQAVELAGEFKTVFAEGSIEEKRLFLRAFLKKIELDPLTGKGQAMLIVLPGMQNMNDRIKGEHMIITQLDSILNDNSCKVEKTG